MNVAQWIQWASSYFQVAALLTATACVICLASIANQRFPVMIRFSNLNRLGKILIFASFFIPASMVLLPKHTLLKPSVQVWSGLSKKTAPQYALLTPISDTGQTPDGAGLEGWIIRESLLKWTCIGLVFGVLFRLGVFSARLIRLGRFLRELPGVKKIGSVSILVSDRVGSPFSCWNPLALHRQGRSAIVLPIHFLIHKVDRRVALAHEIQHQRVGDTQIVFVFELLKAIFFWNPAVFWLSSLLTEIQEFACDEVLIGHRKFSPQAYGSCLLRVAESVVQSRFVLVGTTSMAGALNGSLLKRRMTMLFQSRKMASKRALLLLVLGTLTLMTSFAYASRSAIQDRKITMPEAREFAKKAAEGTEIPINMNEIVLEKLNRYVGTPEGRQFVKEALGRLPNYRAMIDQKTHAHGLPEDLIAIAMYESGFENDVVSAPPHRAAGIWQFVAQTARNYDLIVNTTLDERTNPEKETEAAMRYLGDLFDIFQDWRLALKAYNEGERKVLRLIQKYQTRDPWVLERAESSEGYLAGATAMLIIYKNPELSN